LRLLPGADVAQPSSSRHEHHLRAAELRIERAQVNSERRFAGLCLLVLLSRCCELLIGRLSATTQA